MDIGMLYAEIFERHAKYIARKIFFCYVFAPVK